MADVAQRTLDGELLLAFPRPDPEKKNKRRWARKNQVSRRAAYRRRALLRIAEAWNDSQPVCYICGCPHIEALTFGHPDGNGGEHRLHINKTASESGRRRTPQKSKTSYRQNRGGYHFSVWIKNATLEEIREWNVRLECTYCNFYEAFNGHYPEPDKRPQWGDDDR